MPQTQADHDVAFIGDVRLSQLKGELESLGIDAAFARGKLICCDKLVISKQGDEILVDGPFCDEYFRIRDILYNQFAIA